jgi:uncharacterized protein
MGVLLQMAASGILFLVAGTGAQTQCTQAGTPIEQSICSTPDLQQADAELNRLYSDLRPQLTAKARADLLAQQRAWLSKRNRECATAEAGCLRKQYKSRLDELKALDAAAQTSDDNLDDATPVIVEGSWKATRIEDPAGHDHETGLRQSLEDAKLPAPGGTIKAGPGTLCLPQLPCGTMGWTQALLGKTQFADALKRVFGLSPDRRVLEGTNGSKYSSLLLMPQKDGTAWAFFSFCGTAEQDCRMAAEVWTPASADAAVIPGP